MGNQLSPIVRRRIDGSPICSIPIIYVDRSSTYSDGSQVYNGRYYNISTMYMFATSNTPDAILNWEIKVYDSSGTQQGQTYTGTTSSISSSAPTLFGSSSGYSVPTGGSLQVSGYMSKSGCGNSDAVSYRIYRNKQTLELVMTPSGTYPYYKYVEIVPNFDGLIPGTQIQNVDIHYTTALGGSTPPDPTTGSPTYTSPILCTSTSTIIIKAKAFSTDGAFNDSQVYTGVYVINRPALTAPSVTPSDGTYTTPQVISMSNPNDYGNIYYTTDGTTPTTGSYKYEGVWLLSNTVSPTSESMTIKAIVIEPVTGVSSPVTTRTYTIHSVPTLTVEVTDITADSAVLHGTLTYDSSIYLPPRAGGDPHLYHDLGFVFSRIGDLATTQYIEGVIIHQSTPDEVSVVNTDFNRVNVNSNSGTVTIEYEYNITNLCPEQYIEARATAHLKYLKRPYYNEYITNYYEINSSIINFTTLASRGKCRIKSGGIIGQTYFNQLNTHYYMEALFAPINLSFQSNYNTPEGVKNWGRCNLGRLESDYNDRRMDILRSPWSFIGSSHNSDSYSELPDYNNCSSNHADCRDLFGWGTSFNSISPHQTAWQPWSTSTTDTDYNSYNSSDSDLRNVRSAVRQTYPAEPNGVDVTEQSFQNPRMWGDWAMMAQMALNKSYYNWGEDLYHSSNKIVAYAAFGINPDYIGMWLSTVQGGQTNSKGEFDNRLLCGCSLSPKYNYYEPPSGASPYYSVYCYRYLDGEDVVSRLATLSKDEWNYILFERSGNRFAKGRIQCTDYYGHSGGYVNGLFIFSDQTPQNILSMFSSINTTSASFGTNTITESTWRSNDYHFENYVTFLPAAGYRTGTTCTGDNSDGYYWTRSVHTFTPSGEFLPVVSPDKAWAVHFNNSTVEIVGTPRSRGCSVRLARYIYTEV